MRCVCFGLQARIELSSCRLGGVLGRALAELSRRDRLAYRRIVLGMGGKHRTVS